MLDLSFIRKQPNAVRKAIRDKQLGENVKKVDELLLTDEELRLLRGDLEQKQAERNTKSKRIGRLKREGQSAEELIREMGDLSNEVKRLEEKSRSLEAKLHDLMLEIPNIPHESVPYGESEHDNVVVKEWAKTHF